MLNSMACQAAHFDLDWYAHWAAPLGYPPGISLEHNFSYRKIWEWCAIAQALSERGMLRPGRRGLGFAVGREGLASLFARAGAQILATDHVPELSDAHWLSTGQHAAGLEDAFHPHIIERLQFFERVSFQAADMRTLKGLEPGAYDFLWSSCAIEHLGTLGAGLEFVKRAMDLLKPGGVAVHTTEFNCSSDDDTLFEGDNVIYRRQDIERLAFELRRQRCWLARPCFELGEHPDDIDFDEPPYFTSSRRHVKLLLADRFVSTSYVLIVQKSATP